MEFKNVLGGWIVFNFLALFPWAVFSKGDMTFQRFEAELRASGVSIDCPVKEDQFFEDCAGALRSYVRKNITALNAGMSLDGGKSSKDSEEAIEFLSFAADELERLQRGGASLSPLARESIYMVSMRVTYSALSISREGLQNESIFVKVPNLIVRGYTVVPYTPVSALHEVVSVAQSKKEAKFLVHPGNNHEFVEAIDMAQMTPSQIADLDVSESHPNWYSRRIMEQKPHPWRDLENWVNAEATHRLRKAGQLTNDTPYDLNQARRVLMMAKILNGATSPKVLARDVYGLKWKVKWGNEVQSEPIASRLYVQLGAKYSDLVYANEKGFRGLVLVLSPQTESDGQTGMDCGQVSTVAQFKRCFLESKYNFDPTPYILDSGTITEGNEDFVLEQLDSTHRRSLRGRQYVTFRESSVEFSGSKVMKSGGPVAGSLVGAQNDRAARGSLLFNLWINNIDAKDENNKAVLLRDFTGKKWTYLEAQHDMGASFGTTQGIEYFPTMVNYFETEFIEDYDSNYGWSDPHRFLKFKGQLLYKPKAWEHATHSDLLWMARQISNLSVDDIREAVRSTQWPDFMIEAMTYRLVKRRNQIAEFYATTLAGGESIPVPRTALDLTTPQKRTRVATHYGLPVSQLESALRREGLLDANGISNYRDIPVADAKIASCTDSLLINLLEVWGNPSGLVRRVTRTHDNVGLPYCHWKP